ncbi:MAG TPA: helix-turn-helix domain-containing protein [Candidatus Limnocylindrales bacterium]|nr:helix-turn-helix domain-containing protein [Candidatus Limnocylindrales bacterium]
MDDLRIGAVLRSLRLRLGLTQAEPALKAGVSPAMVSRLEHGRIERTDVRTLRRVFVAPDARIDLVPRWQGAELDRLLDARHAGLTEVLVRRLSSLPDWIVQPDVTFSIYGERGSIYIVAWHPGRLVLLIIEVKSAIGDIGALIRQADRYRRLARQVARERGWTPTAVGIWVVVADGRTARRRLAEHRLTLRRAFPVVGHAMERWIHAPGREISGLSFLPSPLPMNAWHAAPRPAFVG